MSRLNLKPLFIQGPQKSGTSTLVGILNTHPEILLLYETRMDQGNITKYGNQLLEKIPDVRKYFRVASDISDPYLDLGEHLMRSFPDLNYRYVGDKLISLNPQETWNKNLNKTIYTIRDIRTWLAKEQIVRYFRTDLDIVSPSIDYLRYLMGSCLHPDRIHIKLEDILNDDQGVITRLSDFLDLDLSSHAGEWWKTIGKYDQNDPKSYTRWFDGHQSSRIKPGKPDTVVELSPNPFWQNYLPLFDKYFQRCQQGNIQPDEIQADLGLLNEIQQYSPIKLIDAYQNIDTERLGVPEKSADPFLIKLGKRLLRK
jgi:hypothetical protein